MPLHAGDTWLSTAPAPAHIAAELDALDPASPGASAAVPPSCARAPARVGGAGRRIETLPLPPLTSPPGGHATSSTAPAHQTTGLRERGNDTSKSTGRTGRQNAATRRNMRREERVTVQGPVKKQQPDGMSHRVGTIPDGAIFGVQAMVLWTSDLCSGGGGGARMARGTALYRGRGGGGGGCRSRVGAPSRGGGGGHRTVSLFVTERHLCSWGATDGPLFFGCFVLVASCASGIRPNSRIRIRNSHSARIRQIRLTSREASSAIQIREFESEARIRPEFELVFLHSARI